MTSTRRDEEREMRRRGERAEPGDKGRWGGVGYVSVVNALAVHELRELEALQPALVLAVEPGGKARDDLAVETLGGLHDLALVDVLVVLSEPGEGVRRQRHRITLHKLGAQETVQVARLGRPTI
jgi:hypothetical protein